MAEAEELQRVLVRAQNPDGGWGYESGSSWTEPTAFALLALAASNLQSNAYQRGCVWLAQNQRVDGGWPPKPSVQISTWVGSLAILALSEIDWAADKCRHGIGWLTGQIKPEFSPIQRLAFRVRGLSVPIQPAGGSPWFPGTAAWVSPTVMSILALSSAVRKGNDENLRSHINDARIYLLSRRCRDGGWNHGGSKYRSENANSYPETTGMALLAVYGLPPTQLDVSLQCAKNLLRFPGSIEALSWLQLGFARHGIDVLGIRTNLECRTSRDLSLRLLALSARSNTNRLLVEV